MEELLKRTKCFEFVKNKPNEFALLTLVRKIRTRGATESQSRNSNVNWILEFYNAQWSIGWTLWSFTMHSNP